MEAECCLEFAPETAKAPRVGRVRCKTFLIAVWLKRLQEEPIRVEWAEKLTPELAV